MSLPTYRWERVGSMPEELVLVNNDTDEVLEHIRESRAFGWFSSDDKQYFSKSGVMRAVMRKHGIFQSQVSTGA